MADSEVWFDSCAKRSREIPGIRFAGAAGTGQVEGVDGIVRSLDGLTPAAVWYYAGGEMLWAAGGWGRMRHDLEMRIYIPTDNLRDAFGELMKYPARVVTTMPSRSKAYGTLASLVLTGFGRVQFEEWPPTRDGTGKIYLVLPCLFEAKEEIITDVLPQ